MISDILSDAVAEIDEYQQTCPDMYSGVALEITVVTTVMEALRLLLDSPPILPPEGIRLRDEVTATLRQLDVVPVKEAYDRIVDWAAAVRAKSEAAGE